MFDLRDYPAYRVTPDAHIYSIDTGFELKQSISHGYPMVRLYNDTAGHSFRVAVIVATAFVNRPGPPDLYKYVGYHDKNPLNCRATNLFWKCTQHS